MNGCRIFLVALMLALHASLSVEAEETAKSAAPPTIPGLRFLGLNEQGHEEWLRLRDEAVMIRIPSGTYLQRPYEGTGEFAEPKPVPVKSFLIDKYELTNAQVARWWTVMAAEPPPPPTPEEMKRTPDGKPAGPALWRTGRGDRDFERDGDPRLPPYAQRTRATQGRERIPATVLTGRGALAYAKHVGARLPTLAEWEKAAGGPKGHVFPWGSAKPDASRARFGRPKAVGPAPVGSFAGGASPYGVMDMAGNVYERVYAPGREDPVVIKGGSWLSPHPLNLRVLDMCVQPMGVAERSVGVRLVMNDPEPDRPTYRPPPAPVLRVATDFSDAVEEARERRVPLFLSLHYDTCGQCDRMRAQLLKDPAFIRHANAHLVVLVGQNAGDASLYAQKEEEAERPVLYPGLDETDLHSIFRRGLNVVGSFDVSPGNFLLDPHLVRPAAEAKVHLVAPARFSKWGADVAVYLSLCREAVTAMAARHGPPVARDAWLKLQDPDPEDEGE